MTLLHRIDAYIIDRIAQPCADWLSSRAGISPYRLATNLFLASAAVEIPRLAIRLQRADGPGAGVEYVAALFGGAALLLDTIYAHKANRMDKTKSIGMNNERALWFTFRAILTLCVAVGSAISLIIAAAGEYTLRFFLADVAALSFISGLYFIAVNRPPPRLRHAIETKLATAGGPA